MFQQRGQACLVRATNRREIAGLEIVGSGCLRPAAERDQILLTAWWTRGPVES